MWDPPISITSTFRIRADAFGVLISITVIGLLMRLGFMTPCLKTHWPKSHPPANGASSYYRTREFRLCQPFSLTFVLVQLVDSSELGSKARCYASGLLRFRGLGTVRGKPHPVRYPNRHPRPRPQHPSSASDREHCLEMYVA
jgi:hypothetical protein